MKNNKYYDVLLKKILNETLEDKAKEVMEKLNFKPGKSFDYVEEGQMCEECGGYKGGEFMEGQMCECGSMYEEMLEMDDRELEIDKKYRYNPKKFDKLNMGKNKEMTYKGRTNYPQGGSQHHIFQDDNKGGALIPDEDIIDFDDIDIEELTERLFGNQYKLDKDKNGKLTKADFDKLRKGVKKHMNEYTMGDDDLETVKPYGDFSTDSPKKIGKVRNVGDKYQRKVSKEFDDYELDESWYSHDEYERMRDFGTEDELEAYQDKLVSGGKKEKAKKEGETEEGNAFTGMLKKTPKGGKFKMGNKEYTDNSSLEESSKVYYRLQNGNDSEIFTESEIVDMIEQIVMEEKSNIKKGITPAGLAAYEKAHKGSGKENEEYMKEFTKKITEYQKDGSKEKFTTDPKHFPKGNGELEKMEKKAYEVSEAGDEFIDNYLRTGMQTLDYDEMHPNEEWMDSIIQGSSKTGNSDEYANAEKTEVNKKLNNTRKKGAYNKAKRAAYNKAPQPVISDKPGQESGKGLHLKNESVDDKKIQKLNEEFNRMKSLIGYNQKTQ